MQCLSLGPDRVLMRTEGLLLESQLQKQERNSRKQRMLTGNAVGCDQISDFGILIYEF